MTTSLTSQDLNEHVTDAISILAKVDAQLPLSYSVKEVLVTHLTGGTSNNTAPSVTIASPFSTSNWGASTAVTAGEYLKTTSDNIYLVVSSGTTGLTAPTGTSPLGTITNGTAVLKFAGYPATAVSSIINTTSGMEVEQVVRIVVTNPGFGYTSVPAVTVGAGSDTVAAAVLQVDPVVLTLRQQLLDTINNQIIEEATHINTTTLQTAIDLNTTTLEDALDRNTDVLAEIRDEFDTTLTNNIASTIQNIDNSTNDLILKTRYDLTNVSGNFIVGEIVSTSTASGRVMHFDTLDDDITVGYISGHFEDNQTLTGAVSNATAKIEITENTGTGASNEQIARGMMILNLKATNKLNDLRKEITNPTQI